MISVPDYSNLSAAEATRIQADLRARTRLEPLPAPPALIAGADISFNKYSEVVYAGLVILTFPALHVVHREAVTTRTRFPYIPGLLAFREAPALIEVWNKLPVKPDLVVLDGQGIAHPRRTGIATHFGVLADVPTIGCAKSLLTGRHEPVGESAGSTAELSAGGEVVGTALRTKARTNLVFVSPGHRITMAESVDIVRACVAGYRIPEPTRKAHLWVNEVRTSAGAA